MGPDDFTLQAVLVGTLETDRQKPLNPLRFDSTLALRSLEIREVI